MKIKYAIVLAFVFFIVINNCFSQDDNNLEVRIKNVEERTKKIEGQYAQEIKYTRDALEENKATLRLNTAEVAKIVRNGAETNDAKLQRIGKALQSSSEFVKASGKSFKAIDVSLVQTSFYQDVIKLNNPTNTDLGFSLKEIIAELINKHILQKDKSINKNDRLNNFVNGILSNPITKIVKSAVPAINTVVSFISNISFGSKKIKEEDFNAFVKELQAYIKYYEGLASSTNEFQSSIEQIKIRTKALEMILDNYLIDRVSDLYKDKLLIEKPYDINKLSAQFAKDKIEAQIRSIKAERGENIILTLQDPRLATSMTIVSQARYIQDELEALTNQYINAHLTYLKSVIDVLNYSKSLNGSDQAKIDKKIASLKEQLDSWSVKFVSLVDIDDVKKQVKQLSNELSL